MTEKELKILKNFSRISSQIFFDDEEGIIKIMPPSQNIGIIGIYVNKNNDNPINKNKKNFGIYDLMNFLQIIGSFEKPEIVFGEKEITIFNEDKSKKINSSSVYI